MNNYIPYKETKTAKNTRSKEGDFFSKGKSDLEKIFRWIQDEWLVLLGGLFLILGFGWLVSQANISSEVRSFAGILTGVVIVVLGTWYYQKQRIQSALLIAIGASIYLVSMDYSDILISKHYIYIFIVSLVAPVYVAIFGFLKKDKIVIFGSQIFFAVVPLIPDTTNKFVVPLFYIFVVFAIFTLVSIKLPSTENTLLSLIIYFIFVTNTLFQEVLGRTSDNVLTFEFLLIACIASLLLIQIRGIELDQHRNMLLTANRAILFYAFFFYVDLKFVPVIFLVEVVLLLLIRKEAKISNYEIGLITFQAAVAYLALEIDIPLEYLLLVTALIIFLVMYIINQDYAKIYNFRLMFLAPVVAAVVAVTNIVNFITGMADASFCFLDRVDFSCGSTAKFSVTSSYENLAIVLVFLSTFLIFLGLLYFNLIRSTDKKVVDSSIQEASVIFNIFLGLAIWTTLRLLIIDKNVSLVTAMILFALIGLGYYFFRNLRKHYKLISFGYLIVLIFRLVVVEFKNLSSNGRIVAFISLGFLFLITGVISKITDVKKPVTSELDES
jgi:hypothetical protein